MSGLSVGHVIQSLPTSVILFDKNKNLIECNQAACVIHQEVPLEELLKSEGVDRALDKGASGEYCSVEYQNGKRWLRLNINPVYDDQGHQVGISVFEKDITSKKSMINYLTSLRGVSNG